MELCDCDFGIGFLTRIPEERGPLKLTMAVHDLTVGASGVSNILVPYSYNSHRIIYPSKQHLNMIKVVTWAYILLGRLAGGPDGVFTRLFSTAPGWQAPASTDVAVE